MIRSRPEIARLAFVGAIARTVHSRLWIAVAVAITVRAANAKAEELATCMASHEAGQVARLDGRLLEARKRLRACAGEGCPGPVQRDCLEFLAEVDRELPSIVVGAVSDEGDLDDVVVTLDGSVVRSKLDGLPIELDPGAHELLFRTPGKMPKRQPLVVRAGERQRMIKVDWSTRKTASESGAASVGTERPVPLSVYLFSGLAVAGAASFGSFAVLGRVKQHQLEACKPFCSSSQVQPMTSRYVAADVSLAIAGASAVTALLIYLARPSVPLATPSGGIAPLHDGVYANLNVAF